MARGDQLGRQWKIIQFAHLRFACLVVITFTKISRSRRVSVAYSNSSSTEKQPKFETEMIGSGDFFPELYADASPDTAFPFE